MATGVIADVQRKALDERLRVAMSPLDWLEEAKRAKERVKSETHTRFEQARLKTVGACLEQIVESLSINYIFS